MEVLKKRSSRRHLKAKRKQKAGVYHSNRLHCDRCTVVLNWRVNIRFLEAADKKNEEKQIFHQDTTQYCVIVCVCVLTAMARTFRRPLDGNSHKKKGEAKRVRTCWMFT